MSDWNDQVIAEFRANEGRVGGQFDGAPMVLLHHTGRTSGRDYVTPHDVKSLALHVLRHRVAVSYEADAEGLTADDLIGRVLDRIAVP